MNTPETVDDILAKDNLNHIFAELSKNLPELDDILVVVKYTDGRINVIETNTTPQLTREHMFYYFILLHGAIEVLLNGEREDVQANVHNNPEGGTQHD